MANKPDSPAIHGLYAIADSTWLTPDTLLPAVQQALSGGAGVVQYRDKHNDAATRQRLAQGLVQLCRRFRVALIINDDVQLAHASGASGVHLGRDDADIAHARKLLGDTAIIGVSCYNEAQRARLAQQQGADYIAFGSFHASRTKPLAVRADPALLSLGTELRIPVVAIGGITADNGAALVARGASALAVIEGLWGQADVRAAAASYAMLFDRTTSLPETHSQVL
jgi:thiamine-phosphate pyrophosphorylase